jgi:hypothetical protein
LAIARHYATAKPTLDQIRERVLKVVQAYDKVSAEKVLKLFLIFEFFMCSTQVGGRWLLQTRNYSAKEPLTLQLVTERVLLVLKLYDKVNVEKVMIIETFKLKKTIFVKANERQPYRRWMSNFWRSVLITFN